MQQRTRSKRRHRRLRALRRLLLLALMAVFSGSVLLMAGYTLLRTSEDPEPLPDSQPAVRQTEVPLPSVFPPPGTEDWMLTLVNNSTPLEDGYVPELATINAAGHRFDARAASSLKEMLADMEKQGLSPLVCSSYRTWDKQQSLFDRQLGKQKAKGLAGDDAVAAASTIVAYPGTSEHQLGLAADIVALDYQILDDKQQETPEAQWLVEHCAEYGFILRYPPEKSDVTGVIFEPWHYRYVGAAAAREIMDQGLCLEEYLEQMNGKETTAERPLGEGRFSLTGQSGQQFPLASAGQFLSRWAQLPSKLWRRFTALSPAQPPASQFYILLRLPPPSESFASSVQSAAFSARHKNIAADALNPTRLVLYCEQ